MFVKKKNAVRNRAICMVTKMKRIFLVPTRYTDEQIEELYRFHLNPDYFDIQRVAPLPTPIPTNVFNLGKKDWRTELMRGAKC